jgi:hypothetical protein
MTRRFDPKYANCSAICAFAPEPTATMTMTAPMPIIIPNMVKADRILLIVRALKATRRLAKKGVIKSVSLPRQQNLS